MSDSSPFPRVALIAGASGQDVAYLAELLLEKGYVVLGRGDDIFGTRLPIGLAS